MASATFIVRALDFFQCSTRISISLSAALATPTVAAAAAIIDIEPIAVRRFIPHLPNYCSASLAVMSSFDREMTIDRRQDKENVPAIREPYKGETPRSGWFSIRRRDSTER